jgi:two-component system sensor histidine kinase/response regulator
MDLSQTVIDWSNVQDRFEGDLALFCEITRLFLADCPKRLSVMHDALSCGDYRTLERVAHSMRGSVGNFGATTASEAAQRLEELAHRGDAEELPSACASLEREVNRLAAVLIELEDGSLSELFSQA